MELSELLPHLATVADDITLVRSTQTGVNNHGQSLYALHCGRTTAGRPSLGSWLTYGLGPESQNLPAFVVLTDPGGLPVLGTDLWSNGWLPPLYQGTVVGPREPRVANAAPPPAAARFPRAPQPPAPGRASGRDRPGGPHHQLRAGRADANGRQGGPRSL